MIKDTEFQFHSTTIRLRGTIRFRLFWCYPSGAEEFLHGAVRLVNRAIRVSRGAGIRICNGDAAERRPADFVGRATCRPVRIEQWIVLVSITVRPAIDRDSCNVGVRIEAP